MTYKKVKAYTFIDFINKRCKFMAGNIGQVVVKDPIGYIAEANFDGRFNSVNIKIDWQKYNFYIVLQKPEIVKKPDRKALYGKMPHYLIQVNPIDEYDPIVKENLKEITTVEDFISLFYPIPVDLTIKICIDKKSRDFKCLGADTDQVLAMDIKSVDFLSTCIRINA